MPEIIAKCGLICSECPAYIATQQDDDAMRAKTAADWSKEFKREFKPEDINCDGCLAAGDRIIGYCRVCAIRRCSGEKSLANCGLCADYACEKLAEFFASAPEAKGVLDEIARGGKG